MSNIKIYRFGTMVETVLGKLPGMITGCTIRDTRITYEIQYFVDGKFESQWMSEVEFRVGFPPRQSIGFKKQQQ